MKWNIAVKLYYTGLPQLHSQLINRIITSNDLSKIQLILNVCEKDKVAQWYANHPDGNSWILNARNYSAANFYLLKEGVIFE